MAKKTRTKQPKKKGVFGVKAISLIMFLLALWLIGSSLYALVSGLKNGIELDEKQAEEFRLRFENRGLEYTENSLMVFAAIGILMGVAFAAFIIVVGVKLWQGRNWARITVIVISFVFASFSLLSVLLGEYWTFVDLAIDLIIGIYLLVSTEAKRYFAIQKKQ